MVSERTCDICGKEMDKLTHDRLNGLCRGCSEEHLGVASDPSRESYDRKKLRQENDEEF